MIKNYLFSLLGIVVVLLSSCSENDDTLVSPDPEPDPVVENENDFVLVDLDGNRYFPFLRTDKTLHYQFTDKVDLSRLVPFAPEKTDSVLWGDKKLPFDGKSYDFSDFTRNIFFITRNDFGGDDSLKVVIHDLPVLIIATPDSLPIDSKTERKEGCLVKLVTNNEELNLGTAGIKGRGNSTWVEPKKPYNIKLDKKAEILGMKKSKHWILLANAKYDRTQLHNATAFEIARLTDYPWIPSGRYVELVLNGEHKGLYYLCEKIRIEKGKIDIEMDEDKDDVTNCAYLLESIVKTGENNPVELNLNQFDTGIIHATGHDPVWCTFGWEICEPDDNIVSEQSDYIRESLTNVEKLISDDIDSGKYRDFFDIETAIDWWFTEELCINEEASRTKNVYLYKKGKEGKIYLGPIWDLDAWSFGTAGLRTFWAKDYALYYRYLFRDPVFVNRVKEKWAEYRPIGEEKIPKFIDDQYRLIYKSAKRNELMWPDWIVPADSYEQSVEQMKDAFMQQLKWMDEQIQNM